MGWSADPAHVTGVLGGGPDDLPARVREVARVAAAEEQARIAKRRGRKVCRWTEDADNSAWDADCGGKFQIIDGPPSKNWMSWCCYCGGFLLEVPT